MSLRHRCGHAVLRALVSPGAHRFARHSGDLERVQRARLAGLLRQVAAASRDPALPTVSADWQWEQYVSGLPKTDYSDWSSALASQREGNGTQLLESPVKRYQPTSGSTSRIKWIPYTSAFLRELDSAIAPWLSDLYRQYPRLSAGSHYWSVSWLPDEMRNAATPALNDDMALLSGGKRLLAALTQSAPESVALARSSDDALFATLVWLLADRDLAVLSVWSPSFALTLFERMLDWREELVEVLRQGDWGRRRTALPDALPCPRSLQAAAILTDWRGPVDAALLCALWPSLALVSAWDTAAATPWATLLRELLPHAAFQGKGLWATEGVVTLPFRGQQVLAYQSHVYEFEDLHNGRILPPWALRPGQEVTPLISTGSGLLRYRLNDRLRVEGHLNSLPCLRFLGRNDGTDMVGEKIGSVAAQQVLDQLPWPAGLRPVTLLAARYSSGVEKPQPGYVLLVELHQTLPAGTLRSLGAALERALSGHFHYQLARGLGQLAPARVVSRHDMREFYLGLCRRRGMIEGNIKIEPLRDWPEPLPLALGAMHGTPDHDNRGDEAGHESQESQQHQKSDQGCVT